MLARERGCVGPGNCLLGRSQNPASASRLIGLPCSKGEALQGLVCLPFQLLRNHKRFRRHRRFILPTELTTDTTRTIRPPCSAPITGVSTLVPPSDRASVLSASLFFTGQAPLISRVRRYRSATKAPEWSSHHLYSGHRPHPNQLPPHRGGGLMKAPRGPWDRTTRDCNLLTGQKNIRLFHEEAPRSPPQPMSGVQLDFGIEGTGKNDRFSTPPTHRSGPSRRAGLAQCMPGRRSLEESTARGGGSPIAIQQARDGLVLAIVVAPGFDLCC